MVSIKGFTRPSTGNAGVLEAAGVKSHDILYKVNGKNIDTIADLVRETKKKSFVLTVIRDKETDETDEKIERDENIIFDRFVCNTFLLLKHFSI